MNELNDNSPEILAIAAIPTLAEDFLLALRYLYYVKGKPLIPDPVYDAAEREFLGRETTDLGTPLAAPGSDNKDHYSHRVQALALYLGFVHHQQFAELRDAGQPASSVKSALDEMFFEPPTA